MPYPPSPIKSATESKNLVDCLRSVMKQEWVWPDFQRLFQWTEPQMRKLLPSMLRGVPLQNIILWKWESGSDETKDITVYKSLGCAGNCHVRFVEKAVVDGGHRLNCLCYLLDSADENDFVPSFRVTKTGAPYKSPCKLRFYFYLPELKEWLHGRGKEDEVVVAFKEEPSGDDQGLKGNYFDYVPTKTFFPEWDGTSRMSTFIADIMEDRDSPRHGVWLEEWGELLCITKDRIAQIHLNITTIACPRKFAIQSYILSNQTATPISSKDIETAMKQAGRDKTKILDELLEHHSWKSISKGHTDNSLALRVLKSHASQRELFHLATVLLFVCDLKRDGGEWGELQLPEDIPKGSMETNENNEKCFELAAENKDIFTKRLVHAHEQCFRTLNRFPAQYFPKMLVFATFLAFVLADNRNIPKEESMIRMLVRMLCNISRGDKSDRTLDCISRSVQLFKGATLQKLIAFDYMNQLPMWSFKCPLTGDQTNAWVSLLGAIHEDTQEMFSLCVNHKVGESTKMEKHHIFPKGFVHDQNPEDDNHVNSLFNLMPIPKVLNSAISDLAPKEYLPIVNAAVNNTRIKVTENYTEEHKLVRLILEKALRQKYGTHRRTVRQNQDSKRAQHLSSTTMQQIEELKGFEKVAAAMHLPTHDLDAKNFQKFLKERRKLILKVLEDKF